MDEILAVEKELDKVLYKFGSFQDRSSLIIKTLYAEFENLKSQIDLQLENADDSMDVSESEPAFDPQVLTRAKDLVSKLSTEHRDLHSSVSKIGKTIDKNFTSDFVCVSNEEFLSGDRQQLINEVICQHFFRERLINVAETLAEEADTELHDSMTPFFELNRILTSLKERNLHLALEWAERNQEKLRQKKSSLLFKLHRLAYVSLISEGPHKIKEAIDYARVHLTRFVHHHENAIQTLLGCLLYARSGLQNSPYSNLLSSCQWVEIFEVFRRDACSLLGLSIESPLLVCVNVGCTALPALLNIKQAMQQQRVHNIWNTNEELPVEIELGQDCRYHSIFTCPILRQQSTEINPPMRLICGHIISKDALNKLTNSGNKLKCPYCPVEQSHSAASHIYF